MNFNFSISFNLLKVAFTLSDNDNKVTFRLLYAGDWNMIQDFDLDTSTYNYEKME